MSNIIYTSDGNILVFGDNSFRQLGFDHNNNIYIPILLMNDKTIKKICCKTDSTILYKENGDLYVFGSNVDGELGLSHNNEIFKPTLIMNDHSIKDIVCGIKHTILYKENGDVIGFGNNFWDQLGLDFDDYNNFNTMYKPTLIMNDKTIKNIVCGDYHTFIYRETGEVLVSDLIHMDN